MSLLFSGQTSRDPHAECPRSPQRIRRHVFRAVGHLNQKRRGKHERRPSASWRPPTRYACAWCGKARPW